MAEAAKQKREKQGPVDPDSLAEVTILDATLKLARLQHKNGDYKNAIKNYEAFMEGSRTNTAFSPQQDTLALNGLIGARQAPIMKQKPTLYTVRKEPLLNSRRADFSPALLGDDSELLYWTSTRPQATGDDLSGITGTKYADIFFSKKDDKGKWSAPEKVEGELNTEQEEGVCCFTPDGKTMYLTRCTSDSDYPRYAQIYTSQRSDASWSKPQELKISKDTLSCFAHPAVSPDGRWLYFVSDMPGGHGGKDIWRISIEGKTLGGAENLGAPINTPGDELFPTFRPNGDLYFSSDGHPGMGGLDLFVAQQDTVSHKWTVKNLGCPMNSAGDDFGMTFEGVFNRGFFSSNRGDARGWDHLLSFECPEVLQTVRGWVYEKDGYELPAGLVHMIGNDGTNQKISVRGDGSFTVVVQPLVEYIFLGTCKGYLNHVEQLKVDTSSVSQEYVLQFPLASITAPVLVRNVFYEFDSAALTESSTAALDSLVTLLEENPNVTIELSSHCDYRGNDAYNERLSQRRAESVVNYLIEHGIPADRLTPKGYGESRPKIVKRRIAEQHAFLHEGDTLTEAFIRALDTEEKQEICNALNRRTEFRVLRTTYGLFDKPVAKPEPAAAVKEPESAADTLPEEENMP
ncbi:MAG: OmpA family protein [Bacteroidaceae bacterium]|nr:OmpA family protein [Bacteroidaceae bacterium]